VQYTVKQFDDVFNVSEANYSDTPSFPVESSWAMMIVWRIRGKITYQNCSVLCCIRQLYTMIRTHVSIS